jgi:hypothetical protein
MLKKKSNNRVKIVQLLLIIYEERTSSSVTEYLCIPSYCRCTGGYGEFLKFKGMQFFIQVIE